MSRGEAVEASRRKPQAVTAKPDPSPPTFTPPDSREDVVRRNKNTVETFETR